MSLFLPLLRGLGLERLFLKFLKLYSDPNQLVLVLNTSAAHQVTVQQRGGAPGVISHTPTGSVHGGPVEGEGGPPSSSHHQRSPCQREVSVCPRMFTMVTLLLGKRCTNEGVCYSSRLVFWWWTCCEASVQWPASLVCWSGVATSQSLSLSLSHSLTLSPSPPLSLSLPLSPSPGRVTETSSEAFILRMFRESSKVASSLLSITPLSHSPPPDRVCQGLL